MSISAMIKATIAVFQKRAGVWCKPVKRRSPSTLGAAGDESEDGNL